MTPEVNITWMSGAQDGESVRLVAAGSPPHVTFGRIPACSLAMPQEPDASREHARLTCRDGQWWLEDLSSTNGTFLGEFEKSIRVTSPMPVQSGQIFRIGRVRFLLEFPQEVSIAGQECAKSCF